MAYKKWLFVAAAALAALVAIPRVAAALKAWEAVQRQAAIAAARAALTSGADGVDLTTLLTPDGAAEDPNEGDDAAIRRLALAAEIGPRPPEAQQYLIDVAAQEIARWGDPAAVAAAAAAGATVPGTRKWTNLGPLAARTEFNGSFYRAMDSGRPTTIAVHPGNPNRTFLGTSGGGVWFADLSSNAPSWQPITDNLGALAIGAIAIDPNFDTATGKVTIWLGLGDAFDQQSGVLVKGTYAPGDQAGIWGPAIALGDPSHPADKLPTAPLNIRQIRIDPTNTSHLFVGTDDGLYISADAGATFKIVDLPKPAPLRTRENVWEIQYLGAGPAGSQWLVSGVYACPTLPGATVGTRPPAAQQGSVACANDSDPTHYNKGDFWKSIDGGATWISVRATNGLFPEAQVLAADVGRIAFATGSTAGDPGKTVVYAMASTVQETTLNSFTPATAAYLKSVDGGSTWTRIATGLSLANPPTAPTAVTNPTTQATEAQSGCTGMNLGHVQSWYNLAVAVDPGDPGSNRVLFGGDLCSAVTVDGGKTFQLASHWLPQGGQGLTKNGFLAYVHADWHVALALRIPGQPAVLLAGTDGGLFVTRNIWDVPTPELGSWTQPNAGLATHLFYGIGTGDPTLGNPNVVFGGLQDNGSRWRLVADESFIADFNPGNWDQVLGGDGVGAASTSDTNGQNQVYWISVNGSRRFCVPRAWDCSQATRIQNGVETPNWRNPGSPGVADPFLIRYDPLGDDSGAVASASNDSARLWAVDPVSLLASIRVVVPSGSISVDGTPRSIRGMGLRVSPYRYTIDGVPNTRIYGGVTTSAGATVASTSGSGSFLVYDKPGVGATTVVSPHGINLIPKGSTVRMWIGNASDFATPQNPASLGGTDSKSTWLVSSNAVLSNPFCGDTVPLSPCAAVQIPDSVGHVFKTTDGGNTWTAFHGNGTGFDLPNVPVFVLRYDPSDTTDQTIWVGTELGVYRTTDGGNTWAPYGTGLPAVRVTDIRISSNGSLVRISTYGRGVWEIYPHSEPAVANGSGDFDRTKVIDFFNVASLAARMGSTPSAVNNLVYDSAVDLDGTSTIDDADVAALMAKFGSTIR